MALGGAPSPSVASQHHSSQHHRLLHPPHAPRSDYILLCLPPSALAATAAALAAALAPPPPEAEGGQGGGKFGGRCGVLVCLSVEARRGACEVAHQRLSPLADVCGSVEAWTHTKAAARMPRAAARRTRGCNPTPMRSRLQPCVCVCMSQARRLMVALRCCGGAAPPSLLAVHHAIPRDNVALRPGGGGVGGGGGAEAEAAAEAGPRRGTAQEPRYSAVPALLAGLGHAAAAAALTALAAQPLTPSAGVMSRGQRDDLWKAVVRRERESFGAEGCDVWPEDVEYLTDEVWGRPCPDPDPDSNPNPNP